MSPGMKVGGPDGQDWTIVEVNVLFCLNSKGPCSIPRTVHFHFDQIKTGFNYIH